MHFIFFLDWKGIMYVLMVCLVYGISIVYWIISTMILKVGDNRLYFGEICNSIIYRDVIVLDNYLI